jgi:hypothetical protein
MAQQKPYVHIDENSNHVLIDPFGKSYVLETPETVAAAKALCNTYHSGSDSDFSEKLMDLAEQIAQPHKAFWYLDDTCIGGFPTLEEAIEALQTAEEVITIFHETKDGVIEEEIPKKDIRVSLDD